MKKIAIHIGYAKTGSSTLQKYLFNRHPEINNLGLYPTEFIGKYNRDSDIDRIDYYCEYLQNYHLRKFYDNLLHLDDIEYKHSNNLQLFAEKIEDKLLVDKVNLFSNEWFVTPWFTQPLLMSKAKRAKKIFPTAKIIVIIRNQLSLIKSQYRDLPFNPREVRIGNPVSINQWINICLEDRLTPYLKTLKYSHVLNVYTELFGKQNVCVLMAEDLFQQPQLFSEQISGFLNIDFQETKNSILGKKANEGVSRRFNNYRRLRRLKLLPNFYSEKLNFIPQNLRIAFYKTLEAGKKETYDIDLEVKDKVIDYFSASNKELQQSYGLNIAKYQYPMH